MRISTRALFLFGSLVIVACSGNNDSLGTKGDNQGQDKCSETDPSTLGCGNGTACPTGMVCDPNACHPSSCSCDPASGDWQCTADCGYGSCVPDPGTNPPVCEGPDPSLGCDGGCPEGSNCDPNACRPSNCGCSEQGWICTDDCGSGGACVPTTNPKTCEGKNPSLGCEGGCPDGQICDPNACKSSSCGCDTTTGSWICTADCGGGGACVDDSTKICTTPDPSAGCDGGCPAGFNCDPSMCKPSTCSCDPAIGSWLCTDDCISSGVCVAD